MADVSSDLKNWSTTAASNNPTDSTVISSGLADNFQQLQATVRQDLASKGADIASASTTDLGAVPGLFHDITGTTSITSFGTVAAGIWKVIKFEGVLTLTHNGTSLILPTAANITTANGDVAIVSSEGSGNWRCHSYMRASGQPIATEVSVASLATSGNATVSGALAVTGNATVTGTLNANGGAAVTGNLSVSSDLSVDGNVSINQSGGTLLLGGPITISPNAGTPVIGYVATAGGDAYSSYEMSAGTNWGHGVDLSESSYVFSREAGVNALSSNAILILDSSKNVVVGSGEVSSSATSGFFYIPGTNSTNSGVPFGTPTSYTGRHPIIIDDTNYRIYVYAGGAWRYAALT